MARQPQAAKGERRYVDVLGGVVQRSKQMQMEGRLQSRESRAEIELPEHELRSATAGQVMIVGVPVASSTHLHARRLAARAEAAGFRGVHDAAARTLARELCEASQAICEASVEVQQGSRRVLKRVYLSRLPGGAT